MRVLQSLLAASGVNENSYGFHDQLLLISDVAQKVDLEPKTIRFYEKMGLLKPKRIGQLRVFADSDIEVLLFVKKLRQYGMPIAQVREALLLHLDDDTSGDKRIQMLLSAQLRRLLCEHQELAKHIDVLNNILMTQSSVRAA
jgi:DNA-binding transcriptional MerR regulator